MKDQIKDFIHYVRVERGLSQNTMMSYERDLKSYSLFLTESLQITSWNDVTRLHIIQYLKHIKDSEIRQDVCEAFSVDPVFSSISVKGKSRG